MRGLLPQGGSFGEAGILLVFGSLKHTIIMGRIKQGILGGFSGRVGTVVGSSWKNVSYMRALAISVSNPRTMKQQAQRGRFLKSLRFLCAVVPYVRTGYKQLAQGCSAFNAAMSYVLRHAVTGSGTNLAVDYERALVARGTLMPVLNAAVAKEAGKLSFSWDDNSGMGDALATDLAMPLAYNKVRGEAVYLLSGAARGDGKAELVLPDNWGDEALAVYLAFASENGARVADSVCLQNDAYEEDVTSPGTGGDSSGDGDQGESPLG